MKKIFVISSTEDEVIVRSFIENILIGAFGIRDNDILMISKSDVKFDDSWKDNAVKKIKCSDLILAFKSKNYKENFAEGVARATGKNIIPFRIPDSEIMEEYGYIKKDKFEYIVEERLDLLRDKIIAEAQIDANALRTDRWTLKKKEFIKDIKVSGLRVKVIINFFKYILPKLLFKLISNYSKASA